MYAGWVATAVAALPIQRAVAPQPSAEERGEAVTDPADEGVTQVEREGQAP